MSKPVVVVTEGSDPKPLAWLREQVDLREVSLADPALDAALSVAEGLVIRTYTKVTEAFLGRCPKLKVVGRGGVGVENIDVKACRARGIEVVYTPDANTLAVGDFVFGYILQLLRPWCFFRDRVYEPAEFKKVRETHRGRQLNELTLGILGMGRVGRRVCAIAAGLRHEGHLQRPAGCGRSSSISPPTAGRQADALSRGRCADDPRGHAAGQ